MDHTVKLTNPALIKVVTDTESVCRKTMGTLVAVLKDTLVRTAKLSITVLVSFVAIMGRVLVELMTIHAIAMMRFWARTVKQLIIVMIGTVLIMEHVTTPIIHTAVPVIRDILGQIVNTRIVRIMDVRMAQHVSMEILIIRVNALIVFLVIIVKPVIIVTIKTATTMASVRMEKLIILVNVNRDTEE